MTASRTAITWNSNAGLASARADMRVNLAAPGDGV